MEEGTKEEVGKKFPYVILKQLETSPIHQHVNLNLPEQILTEANPDIVTQKLDMKPTGSEENLETWVSKLIR